MRYKVGVTVLVVMLLAAGCVGGGTRTASPAAQIHERLDALEKAWGNMDPIAFANQFRYPVILGPDNDALVQTAEEMREIFREVLKGVDKVHSSHYLDRHITIDGNRAVISTIWVIDATVYGERGTGAAEVILEARGGNWKFTRYVEYI